MTEFINNTQNNAKNEIRSRAEDYWYGGVGKVPKYESENVALFRGKNLNQLLILETKMLLLNHIQVT